MKVKFVICHDIIELSLGLLVATQLVLKPLENLLLGRLLLHAIIIPRLVLLCNRIFRGLFLGNAILALGMRKIQVHLQLILVLLEFNLHELVYSRMKFQEYTLYTLLIQEQLSPSLRIGLEKRGNKECFRDFTWNIISSNLEQLPIHHFDLLVFLILHLACEVIMGVAIVGVEKLILLVVGRQTIMLEGVFKSSTSTIKLGPLPRHLNYFISINIEQQSIIINRWSIGWHSSWVHLMRTLESTWLYILLRCIQRVTVTGHCQVAWIKHPKDAIVKHWRVHLCRSFSNLLSKLEPHCFLTCLP